MQAMEEWTAIYTELLFRNIKIQSNSGFFFLTIAGHGN